MVITKETIVKLSLFILVFVFILSACGGGAGSDSGISTWTPSPIPTATCIPDVNLSTPEGWGARVVVFLYDDRPILDDYYLQLENGERIKNPSLFIKTVVPKLFRPNDQISVFQLGYSSFDDAIVSRLFSFTTPPDLFSTPLPPNIIPTNSPAVLTPGFGYVATQNAMTQQAKVIAATNGANETQYRCAIDFWNRVVQQTATVWDGVATAEISNITENMVEEFAIYSSEAKKLERDEPYRTNELYYGGIYYGLSFATIVFGEQCRDGVECILVIVDDLNVYGKNNPDNLAIDLENVRIIATMPNCRFIDQPDCVQLQEYWTEEFSKFGASNIEYRNGDRAESNIIDYAGR